MAYTNLDKNACRPIQDYVTPIDQIYTPLPSIYPTPEELLRDGKLTVKPRCLVCNNELAMGYACVYCESMDTKRKEDDKKSHALHPETTKLNMTIEVQTDVIDTLVEEKEVLQEALEESERELLEKEARIAEMKERFNLLRELYAMRPKEKQLELPLVSS